MQNRLVCTLLSLMKLVGCVGRPAPAGEYNTHDFGAKGDGTTIPRQSACASKSRRPRVAAW